MDVLNLPAVRVVSVDEQEDQYRITAEADTKPDACADCASTSFYAHGYDRQLFADIPIHGKMVTILLDRRRFKCRLCGTTVFQPLSVMALNAKDGDGPRLMTKRLVAYVAKAGMAKTFVDVARDTGLHERTVRRIVSDRIKELESAHRFETPNWLGIDEIHILGRVCGVLANVERNCIYDILPSRDKKTMGERLAKMQDKDLIEAVCTDMWAPYRDAIAEQLPRALLVVDRFHIVRMANDAVDTVRKTLRKGLPKEQRIKLKDQRFLLYGHERRLTDQEKQVVAMWTTEFPLLGEAWAAKELFMHIWDKANSSKEAGAMMDAWIASLPIDLTEPFYPLVRAVINWRAEILRYFDKPCTNGYTESLNSVIRAVNHAGRGYTFEVLRAKMLYVHGRHVLDGRKLDRRRKDAPAACISGRLTSENSMVWGVDFKDLENMLRDGFPEEAE